MYSRFLIFGLRGKLLTLISENKKSRMFKSEDYWRTKAYYRRDVILFLELSKKLSSLFAQMFYKNES
jgi:hypothetical protein